MQFTIPAVFVLTMVLGIFQCAKAPQVVNVSNVNKNATLPPAQRQQQGHTDHSEHDAPRITLAEAKADFDAGRAVFVDSRSAGSFNIERIKGAVNVPVEAVEANYKKVPMGKKVIVYCS